LGRSTARKVPSVGRVAVGHTSQPEKFRRPRSERRLTKSRHGTSRCAATYRRFPRAGPPTISPERARADLWRCALGVAGSAECAAANVAGQRSSPTGEGAGRARAETIGRSRAEVSHMVGRGQLAKQPYGEKQPYGRPLPPADSLPRPPSGPSRRFFGSRSASEAAQRAKQTNGWRSRPTGGEADQRAKQPNGRSSPTGEAAQRAKQPNGWRSSACKNGRRRGSSGVTKRFSSLSSLSSTRSDGVGRDNLDRRNFWTAPLASTFRSRPASAATQRAAPLRVRNLTTRWIQSAEHYHGRGTAETGSAHLGRPVLSPRAAKFRSAAFLSTPLDLAFWSAAEAAEAAPSCVQYRRRRACDVQN
jgi:hypothetical protein